MPIVILFKGGGGADSDRSAGLALGFTREISWAHVHSRSIAFELDDSETGIQQIARRDADSLLGLEHSGQLLRFLSGVDLSVALEHVGIRQIVSREPGMSLGIAHSGVTDTVKRTMALSIGDVSTGALQFVASRTLELSIGDSATGYNVSKILSLYGAAIVHRYELTIGDISPPIKNFNLRTRGTGKNYLQVTIPDGDTWADAVADASNGSMVLRQVWTVGGVRVYEEELAAVPIENIGLFKGVDGYSINLQGSLDVARVGVIAELPAVSYWSQQRGKMIWRSPKVHLAPKAGDDITYDGDKVYIDSIIYNVSVGSETMEIQEGPKPCTEPNLVIEAMVGIIAVSNWANNSMVVKSGGQVVGWGNNEYNQTNPASSTNPWVDHTATIETGAAKIYLAKERTFIVTPAGNLRGWGKNDEKQVNPDSPTDPWTDSSLVIADGIKQVTGGDEWTSIVKNNGDLYGWGKNDGFALSPNHPYGSVLGMTKIAENVESAFFAATGHGDSERQMVLKTNGDLTGWGDNGNYCIDPAGNSVIANDEFAGGYFSSEPRVILRRVKQVACGAGYTMAIDMDGKLHGWGWNYDRQCNPSYGGDHQYDTEQVLMTGILAIACGAYHTMAIKPCGDLIGWGNNDYGQINPFISPSTEYTDTTTAIMTEVVAVACGTFHTIVVKFDGTVYAWGRNNIRQSDPRSAIVNATTPITQR